METLTELLERLNLSDECNDLEAKKASEIGKSLMETVCAFSNEPDLGGGYILMGVEKEDENVSLFPSYIVTGIAKDKLDKIQTDFSTQCADSFNMSVRPVIKVETLENGETAIVAFVPELSPEQKPLFIKNKKLPEGAFRRIGSADHKCTEDDMVLFYHNTDSLDKSVIKDAVMDDISEDAVGLYRKLRSNVNPSAEELTYNNLELLQALNAVRGSKDKPEVTYTGVLCFGSRLAQRRLLPMIRVDYIRVSTNKWIENPDKRFESTLDMRGSILEMVQRIISTISDDLPKGFVLNDSNIQAKNIGLPMRVLREAVVNALIHRSYRENSPVQIIRYPNRIEIINPGYSLKTEEQLGEPGSVNRNPFISAIFHETNLAETKGSGIRTMRNLMKNVGMMPPTFESSRDKNTFTVLLLLHHLLNEEDLGWLQKFDSYELNDNQKRILIFLKEVHAIDNSSARQINGCDAGVANTDLRKLKELELVDLKGKNKFAYYTPSEKLSALIFPEGKDLPEVSVSNTALPSTQTTLPSTQTALPSTQTALPPSQTALLLLMEDIPENIQVELQKIGKKVNDKSLIDNVILQLCSWKSLKSKEIAYIIKKSEKHLFREYIKPLLIAKKLVYTYPEMINHPDQAYKTVVDINKNINLK